MPKNGKRNENKTKSPLHGISLKRNQNRVAFAIFIWAILNLITGTEKKQKKKEMKIQIFILHKKTYINSHKLQ